MCLSIRLKHGHKKIHTLSDLLKVRGSERILMHMLQNAAIRYTDLLRISCTSIRKNCAEVGAVVSGWQVRLRRNAAFLCQEAQANPSMFRTT